MVGARWLRVGPKGGRPERWRPEGWEEVRERRGKGWRGPICRLSRRKFHSFFHLSGGEGEVEERGSSRGIVATCRLHGPPNSAFGLLWGHWVGAMAVYRPPGSSRRRFFGGRTRLGHGHRQKPTLEPHWLKFPRWTRPSDRCSTDAPILLTKLLEQCLSEDGPNIHDPVSKPQRSWPEAPSSDEMLDVRASLGVCAGPCDFQSTAVR